eukprot:2022648-Amphidinium_carterae.1
MFVWTVVLKYETGYPSPRTGGEGCPTLNLGSGSYWYSLGVVSLRMPLYFYSLYSLRAHIRSITAKSIRAMN